MQGAGTANDPYLVATAEDLDNVRNDLTAHYKQVADIDLSDYAEGEGWVPIGDDTDNFTGGYDGDGHTITGLMINRPDSDYQGLFGFISTVEGHGVGDITINGAYVRGGNNVGTLAGQAIEALVAGVAIAGAQVVGVETVGGLVGRASTTIAHSYYAGEVVGVQGVGGIAGETAGSLVLTHCHVVGDIAGDSHIGGLSGGNTVSGVLGTQKIMVEFCWANCAVTGDSNYVGGLVGHMYSDALITHSYFTGSVSGINNVGGILGYGRNSGTISHNGISDTYTTGSVAGEQNVGGMAGYMRGPIDKCYTVGAVVGVAKVGGLVGYQGYHRPISNCFALNPSIERLSGTALTFGRIAGQPYSETSLVDNYARQDMQFITND